ncbi:coiled-coil domain-containing protein 116 [Lemur catta]|uniref:coiled-coil domain-containing protein 116 n=1 Tax=Lemur catta TaxID=9447 RepID=UPI001E26C5D5|nr:coiled-coil domain-containing protein 116 [Lemur catta]
MGSCRHHSGYLADDETGHSTYVARLQPPKKPLFPEMGPTSKLGREPHPPSMYGSSALRCRRQNRTGPQPFGTFLDFLTEGQVLESLQTVVEEATERMTAVKTEAGVPLVQVQDPVEMPSDRRRARARPSLRTVHRHRARPSLCTGRPNNYPSCSSSMSDSHGSLTAGQLGSHSWDSDLGARGLGSLPPVTDELLLEKNLKRLLRLENKGKGPSQSCSQDSLLWDSLGSQTSSQWTQEQPLSWFSGLLDSRSGTPEASELGPKERELIFLKPEFNKDIKSLLNQPASFNLPGYSSLRQPHRTLDFLAKHHLFPALQGVVSQAVDKLSGARRRDGCPLFPANFKSTVELPVNFDLLLPGSKFTTTATARATATATTTTTDTEEPCDFLPTTDSSSRMFCGKINGQQASPSTSNAQIATKFRLKNPDSKFSKKQPLPSIPSKPSTSHFSNPWYEELLNFLTQQAVSLLICKYKFENNLSKQLSLVEPKLSVSSGTGVGSSPTKSKEILTSEDSEYSDRVEVEDEASVSKDESGSQNLPQPGAEALVSHSVDVGHSDPP